MYRHIIGLNREEKCLPYAVLDAMSRFRGCPCDAMLIKGVIPCEGLHAQACGSYACQPCQPCQPASKFCQLLRSIHGCGLSGTPPVEPVRQETSKSLSSPAGRRKLGKGKAGKRRDCSRFWRGYSELGRSIIAREGNPAMMFPCRIYSGY